MWVISPTTNEATVVLHKTALWRRLSQAHSTFSSLLLLHRSPRDSHQRLLKMNVR
jgi:hypothetical protein